MPMPDNIPDEIPVAQEGPASNVNVQTGPPSLQNRLAQQQQGQQEGGGPSFLGSNPPFTRGPLGGGLGPGETVEGVPGPQGQPPPPGSQAFVDQPGTLGDVVGPQQTTILSQPFYTAGDEYALFQGLSPTEIKALQNQLIAAGMIDEAAVRPGIWGPETAKAMRNVLGYANNARMDYTDALDILATNPSPAASITPPTPQKQLLPDYDSVVNKVRSLFEQELGRAPTQAEQKILAQEFMSDAEGAIEQQHARAVEAQRRQEGLGARGELADDGELEEAIDPTANLETNFRNRFGEEMSALEELATERQFQPLAQENFSAIRRIVGA